MKDRKIKRNSPLVLVRVTYVVKAPPMRVLCAAMALLLRVVANQLHPEKISIFQKQTRTTPLLLYVVCADPHDIIVLTESITG